jgi:hypothetical protein
MNCRKLLFISALMVSSSCLVFGQRNEASLSLGGIFTSDQTTTSVLAITCPVTQPNCNVFSAHFQTDTGVAIEGSYAFRIIGLGVASLYAEFPVVGAPGRDVNVTFNNGGIASSSTPISESAIFFTPSAKLKILPKASISPFVSIGGGLAHFNAKLSLAGSSSESSQNFGALQYGGGLDFKTPLPFIGFRVEARDYYSYSVIGGTSSISGTITSPQRLHHLFAGGGLVLRF